MRSRAFVHVLENVTPLPFLIVPFTLLVSWLMRNDLPRDRSIVWIATSAGAAVACLVARWWVHRPGSDRVDTVLNVVVLGTALAVASSVFGMSTWVAGSSSAEVLTLFTLFPAIAGAIGASVCAGRRFLYAAFLLPSILWSVLGIVTADDPRRQPMALIAGFYLLCMIVLHQVTTRSVLQTFRLQRHSEKLLQLLATEQDALRAANEKLTDRNATLARLASHDTLTGILNRRGTLEALDTLLAGPWGRPVGLLFCDIDRFKSINDTLGHRGGDQFLTTLAERLHRALDQGCFAGRIGGDEFVVVLPDHDVSASFAVATRLLGLLAQPVHAEGRELPSSVSIGVAVAPGHGTTSSDLLRHANTALYRAKNSGRNRAELYDGAMQTEREAALDAEQALRRAIEDGEIVPFFQPEVDAVTGRMVGAEVLARWIREDERVVSAREFVPLARRCGLLERLSERILTQARPQIRRLASLGLPPGFRFRVNLPPGSTSLSWRDDPLDILVRGIDPRLLTLDVLEASVADDLDTAAARLAAFRARGGRVCLDDFARGLSSLSLLRSLPIDEVRIDGQEIDAIAAHPHDRAIVREIIAVVREIGLTVSADGVETGVHCDALIALGCVQQQGHLYSPALPAAAFEEYLLRALDDRDDSTGTSDDPWSAGELAS